MTGAVKRRSRCLSGTPLGHQRLVESVECPCRHSSFHPTFDTMSTGDSITTGATTSGRTDVAMGDFVFDTEVHIVGYVDPVNLIFIICSMQSHGALTDILAHTKIPNTLNAGHRTIQNKRCSLPSCQRLFISFSLCFLVSRLLLSATNETVSVRTSMFVHHVELHIIRDTLIQ